jgi:hypothetical protein
MDGGIKTRTGGQVDEPDTTTMPDEEAHKELNRLLTLTTTDTNPDQDVIGVGKATIHTTTIDEGLATTAVYGDKGRHTGQLTQYQHRYTEYKRHHPDDRPETFPEELARLVHR